MIGQFSDETLSKYVSLVEERVGLSFSEIEPYDFARCMRSDGSIYGSRGQCRKGTEVAASEGGSGSKKPASFKHFSDKELREYTNLLLTKVDPEKLSEKKRKAYDSQIQDMMGEMRSRGMLRKKGTEVGAKTSEKDKESTKPKRRRKAPKPGEKPLSPAALEKLKSRYDEAAKVKSDLDRKSDKDPSVLKDPAFLSQRRKTENTMRITRKLLDLDRKVRWGG
jgi:hypothetical protein